MTVAVLCSSVFLINLDITVLNVALPTLARDLNASSGQLQWIIDAYSLVFGALLPVSGSLADRFGRKRLFLIGIMTFTAGSAAAALSGSIETLIAARGIMGIGSALMMPPCLSIITNVFRDPAERQQAIGFWAGSSGIGFAVGPVVSGLLLTHFWWGSVFLVNVPIGLAGLVAAAIWLPESRNPAAAAPDITGGLLSVCGLGLLLWSIIAVPIHASSPAIVAWTGGVGLAVLTGFLVWEHHSSHPMMNLAFFRNRGFSVAVLSLCILNFALIGALFVLTQFMQFILKNTPLQAGIRMLPIAVVLVVVMPLSAMLVRHAGRRLVMAAGLALICIGIWQLSRASATWTYADILPALLLAGIGAALVWPTASGSVMASVPREDAGVAAAANSAFLQVGAALGVAVTGSVLFTRYQDRMSAAPTYASVPQTLRHAAAGSIGGALAAARQAGGQAGQLIDAAARAAFLSGMHLSLLVTAGAVLAGCALVLIGLPARVPAAPQVQPGRGDPAAQPDGEDSLAQAD